MPAGFDQATFLRAAKLNFVKLQLANDAGKLDEIREFTTGEMFDELRKDVLTRPAEGQATDVEIHARHILMHHQRQRFRNGSVFMKSGLPK